MQDLYSTPQQVAGYAATVRGSAATQLMNGQPHGVDEVGGIVAYETTTTAVVVVALLAIFAVVRHTRAEEESGHAEMLRAAPVGRHAGTAAALLATAGAVLLVGALDAGVLLAAGLPASGSLLHGAGVAGVGLVFAGIAAAASQVTASARAARGIAGTALAVLFLLRGIGAVWAPWVIWLSPFGWAEEARPFGSERAWPLLLLLAAAVGTALLTGRLLSARDAGAGLRHPRPSPARARPSLGTPVGLAWRLQRGTWTGWAVGLVLVGAVFGSLGDEVVSMVESNPDLAAIMLADGTSDVRAGFFAYGVGFLGVVASFAGVASVLRLRSEETSGRAEALLSTALPRRSWVLGSLAVSVVGSLVVLALCGLAMGATDALVAGRSGSVGSLLGAALGLFPGTLVVVGAAAAAVGWLPRFAVAAWAVAGFALLQNYLGGLLDLPGAVAGLSPYDHLPALPLDSFAAGPVAALTALGLALLAAGLVGVRRRDLG